MVESQTAFSPFLLNSCTTEFLAYAIIHLSAFWSVVVFLVGENLILPYFSSLYQMCPERKMPFKDELCIKILSVYRCLRCGMTRVVDSYARKSSNAGCGSKRCVQSCFKQLSFDSWSRRGVLTMPQREHNWLFDEWRTNLFPSVFASALYVCMYVCMYFRSEHIYI